MGDVYCDECAFLLTEKTENFKTRYWCEAPENTPVISVAENWRKRRKEKKLLGRKPKKINKNNDCKWFSAGQGRCIETVMGFQLEGSEVKPRSFNSTTG